MKKLVLVVAMFMFVCGGSFLVKAQNSAEAVTAQPEVKAIILNDTVITDTVPTQKETVQEKKDTLQKETPAEPIKE